VNGEIMTSMAKRQVDNHLSILMDVVPRNCYFISLSLTLYFPIILFPNVFMLNTKQKYLEYSLLSIRLNPFLYFLTFNYKIFHIWLINSLSVFCLNYFDWANRICTSFNQLKISKNFTNFCKRLMNALYNSIYQQLHSVI